MYFLPLHHLDTENGNDDAGSCDDFNVNYVHVQVQGPSTTSELHQVNSIVEVSREVEIQP